MECASVASGKNMDFLGKKLSSLKALLRGDRFDSKEIDPVAVRFRNAATEADFAEDHFRQHALSTFTYTFLGLAAYMGFGVLDYVYLGEAWQPVILIRSGTCLAMFAFITAWFAYGSKLGYHLMPAIAMGVAGLGIVAMTMVMPSPQNETYYVGLILVVTFFCNLPLLRFYHAMAVSIFLIAFYTISATILSPIPMSVLTNNLFFFGSLTVWSLWTSYWQQLYARQDFFATRKLQSESARNEALVHEAEAANRAKSEFLAVMSHELRTPLNAVLGFSDMIRSQIHGPLGSTDYEEYVGHIHDSGSHLLQLINDILDLSKADSGHLEIQELELDPAHVLRAAMSMMEPMLESGEVTLINEISKAIPNLQGDERFVRQIVTNLLSNAVKFTPKGGTVTVRANKTSSGDFMISIEDTGIGIAVDDLPRVLEPFVQVEGSASRRFEGTGLGLPLARKLVEAHGGYLRIESELDVGTIVTITFPASRVIDQEAEEPFDKTGL